MRKIAVLITCFNRKEITINCLNHLHNSALSEDNLSIDVYLVDDGSTDGTSIEVSRIFPNVKIFKSGGDLFWGRGMIYAWEQASLYNYDFYLWLNDDTEIFPHTVSELISDFDTLNDPGIIVGVCKSSTNDKITYSGYLMKDKIQIIPSGKPIICDFFNGNLVLIHKSIFHKVGFLDDKFHHSLGDIDYGLRAKNMGIKSYVSSKILGICDRHSSLPKWCDPNIKFTNRIHHFNSPLAKDPKQVYIFEKRHNNLLKAILRSNLIYLRLLFPQLWALIGKDRI